MSKSEYPNGYVGQASIGTIYAYYYVIKQFGSTVGILLSAEQISVGRTDNLCSMFVIVPTITLRYFIPRLWQSFTKIRQT